MSRILVVDDDPDILSVMKILLASNGFTVDVNEKAEATMAKIESFKPDLVLLDVLLSGHDGRVICKKIKAEKKLKDLPVIMISAHPSAAAGIKEYGADEFISKPFDINVLLDKINVYLNQ
ncbi:MAG: response regulator [Chitinophagaceae bacterium]|nr:response regulator [Chitinophagaceae bacterium]